MRNFRKTVFASKEVWMRNFRKNKLGVLNSTVFASKEVWMRNFPSDKVLNGIYVDVCSLNCTNLTRLF